MRYKRFLSLGLLVLCSSWVAAAGVDANQVLEKVRNRPDGTDIYAQAKLVLSEGNGSTRTREMLFLQRDYGEDEKLTLYFTDPSDVKGVGLQSVNYSEKAGKEDDQWIYLPAFRQVRRISAVDKRGSFMGSQFAYIDLDKLRVTDYTQKVVGEEKVLDRNCVVIERLPSSESVVNRTGYSKVKVWVDAETFVVMKQSFFDTRGVQFKEFVVKKLENIQNVWTVMESEMTEMLTGRSSALIFTTVKYNVGLSDALFQQAILKTGVNNGNLPALR